MLYAVDNGFIWSELRGTTSYEVQCAFWALSNNLEFLVAYHMGKQ